MSQSIAINDDIGNELKLEADELRKALVSIRRRIHSQPEYGFQEFQTAALIAETLERLGVRVRRGVATTGVVAELGEATPVIAIRADMDALPIAESTDLPFASKVPGMMHACGHDAHIACALGAAMLLVKRRFRGTIRLLFQPSEEQKDADGQSGAMRMVEQQALDGVSAVIALHTKALPVGSIGVTDGPALAASDYFKIVIRGKAAHGAHPEEGVDAIAISSLVIGAVNQIVARRLPAISPAVVSITTIHGGVKDNIIAEQVEMSGTIRSVGSELRDRILTELERALDVGRVLGAVCELRITEGYPVTMNDRLVTDVIRNVGAEVLGSERVVEMPFDTWAEDFGYMTTRVPGAMFWLGVTGPQAPHPVWHSSSFDLDEDCLPVGAAILAASALRLLERC